MYASGAPDLVDRVFAVHKGSRAFDSHRLHMSERFFRSNRPGYLHPVCSELENRGIRVVVGDCSVTGRRLRRPSHQTGKAVHVRTQKHYKHNEDGRTAPDVPDYENWISTITLCMLCRRKRLLAFAVTPIGYS